MRTRGAIEADGDFSADAALSEAGDAPSEAPPSTAASEREEAVGPRSPSGPTTSGENKGEPTAERVIAKWQKQMKKSGGGKGVKFGSNPNDSLFIESVDIGESDVDLSSIDPADLTSDLRRATQTGKGFQSTRMEEERRLASVRVLAVLQNARSLILNWSVVAGWPTRLASPRCTDRLRSSTRCCWRTRTTRRRRCSRSSWCRLSRTTSARASTRSMCSRRSRSAASLTCTCRTR